jgi:3-hydroxymyristoyl/3-hydroxydecanoyl-(acyl carrier protein) dehydratase
LEADGAMAHDSRAEFWTVPFDHPCLAGHFPGRPVVPGALILEEVIRRAEALGRGRVRISEVISVKFLSPFFPGEPLAFQFARKEDGRIRFEGKVGERRVITGILGSNGTRRPDNVA